MIIMLSQSRNLITKNNTSRNHFSKISFPNEFALDNIFFFYYFFFLLYKYDSRRMELSSIHKVIRPSSSLLEFSTLFRNLDPVCLWSLYMFDVRQLFFFSLSPFFTLDCCVTSWPWSLELRDPRSALSRRIEPETKARRRSMMKNLEKLVETEFRGFASFRAARCSFLSAILDIFWGGNYSVGGGMCDSDPAILDFQVHRDGITIKCLGSVDFWIKTTLQFAY